MYKQSFFICVDESTCLYLHGKDIRCIMMKENIKNQIVDIDGYIHVINGKVICFKSDVYDLNNPEDVADLVLTSFEIGVDDTFPLVHGNDTILFLDKNSIVPDELIVSMGDLRSLPKDVQKKCKLAILKQKNQIIDVDGYIHVINGKVICFKSDVYDLNNLKHVEDTICEYTT